MTDLSSDITQGHLDNVRRFYDRASAELGRFASDYRDHLAHYYNLLIPANASVLEVGCGSGSLLARLNAARKVGIDISESQIARARIRLPDAEFHVQAGELLTLSEQFDYIVISDTLNLAADVQRLLSALHQVSHANTRVVINHSSFLWRPLLSLAELAGFKSHQPQSSWLSSTDVDNLLQLADWRPITRQPRLLLPIKCFGIDRFVNRWLAPICGWFCLTVFCVARPAGRRRSDELTVSVVIPARNEGGNIEAAVTRTPRMGAGTELIFVEGHSRDDTWEQIERVAREYPERRISKLHQTGIGKADAVRAGFAVATGDVLMILDADLTVPPEELPKFYAAVATGYAEFANGVRLVYPMDEKAMQFLNVVANKAFGIIFTWLLGQPIKDTLCGTKALRRAHYEAIAGNRTYFGEFDPFGDFDLLFGASKLNLQIAEVPIRYRERTYGATNINRWKHGWLLLRMVVIAARKLKFV